MTGAGGQGWRRWVYVACSALFICAAAVLVFEGVLVVLGRRNFGTLLGPAISVGAWGLFADLARGYVRRGAGDVPPPVQKPARGPIVGLGIVGVVAVLSLLTFEAFALARPPDTSTQGVPTAKAPVPQMSFLDRSRDVQMNRSFVTVVTAHGNGPGTTPTFILRGGAVEAFLTTKTGPVVYFSLVNEAGGAAVSIACQGNCGAGMPYQLGAPEAGHYRLVIDAPADSAWEIVSLNEDRTALSFMDAGDPAGQDQVVGEGTGSYVSPVFALTGGASSDGTTRISGECDGTTGTSFFFVPEGAKLDRKRDLVGSVDPESPEGSCIARLPRPGRYRIVVVGHGPWLVRISR